MSDVLHGSSGTDLIKANADNTQIYGLKGNDTLTNGGKTNVILIGGGGNDSLIVNGGKTTLSGGDGSDVFELNYSATEPLFAVIEDVDSHDKIVVNFDGANQPQLKSKTVGSDVVWSGGDLFNLTLKGVRENDYFDDDASDEIWQILKLTNDERENPSRSVNDFKPSSWENNPTLKPALEEYLSSSERPQLTLSDGLMDGAAIRLGEIVELGVNGKLKEYMHTRPDDTPYYTALTKNYSASGENIASGQSLPAGAMDSWINSASHYVNIVNPNFLKLGVGYHYNDTDPTDERWYWEQLFASTLKNPETVSTADLSKTKPAVNAVEKFTLGTDAAETFNNTLNGATISALGGNDTITNSAVLVSISGGGGNDSITSNGAFTTINAGTGNDTVNITGNGNVLLYTAGDGSDTIIGVDGNDTLKISGDEKFTPVTVGNNVIVGVGENSVTFVDAAAVDLKIDGTRSKLFVGTENAETISATVDGATVQALGGNDSITSNTNATITAGTGNDTVSLSSDAENLVIYNAGDGSDSILGFDDDDTLKIGGDEFTPVTLDGDVVISVGSDSIRIRDAAYFPSINVEGTRSKLYIGTDEDDTITASVGSATINAHQGNDLINLSGDGNLVLYSDEDGDDTINGFTATDTLRIGDGTGTYFSETDGSDVVLSIGNDLVSILGAAGLSLNIEGELQSEDTTPPDTTPSDSKLIRLSDGGDSYSNNADEVTIIGGDGNDTINNKGVNVSISGGGGNDSITSRGAFDTIIGGTGNDTVYNDGNSVTINGGDGADSVSNYGAQVSIGGNAGNDTVSNYGDTVTVNTGNDDDSIYNIGDTVTINTGNGADSIYNVGDSVTVDGGAGDDSIDNYGGDNVTIDMGAGDDFISLDSSANNNLIIYKTGDGTDKVEGFDENDTLKFFGSYSIATLDGVDLVLSDYNGLGAIYLIGAASLSIANIENDTNYIALTEGDDTYSNDIGNNNVTIAALGGNDTIYNSGESVSIDGGNGNDFIQSEYSSSNMTINGGAGDDSIANSGDSVSIGGGAGNDSIYNGGDSVTIDGGAGDDTINNGGGNVTINAGTGDDSIYNGGDSVTISGGDGDDTINNGGGNVTINAGTGDDFIALSSLAANILFTYTLGDGNDTIDGIDATSTISIGGGQYVRSTVGNDLILSVGDGSISLVGAATLSTVNIIGTENKFIRLTEGDDTYSNFADGVTIAALGGNDTIWNGAEGDSSVGNNVSINGGTGNDNIFNYSSLVTIDGGAGNDSIDNSNGSNVSINGGAGDDSINNDGNSVTIVGGNGRDTISNNGTNVTIDAGLGHDYISNFGADTSIRGGGGNDSIGNSGAASVTIDSGDGSDYIQSSGNNVSISAGAGGDGISILGGTNSTTDGGAGNDLIINSASNSSVIGGEGNDSINNNSGGTNSTIDGGAGNDRILNSDTGVFINAGADNDSVTNSGLQVTIDAGNGNETLYNSGANVSIVGGRGVDTIDNDAANVSITGGKDNDRISLGASASDNWIRYYKGDGDDVVWGYSATTTLNFVDIEENAFTRTVRGDDVIINFNSGGSITLKDARDKPINIRYGASGTSGGSSGDGGDDSGGGDSGTGTSGGTSASDSSSHSTGGRGVSRGDGYRGGNDSGVRTTEQTRTTTTTTPTVNTYVYTGGNQVISTYQQGERIIFGEVYTGAFYDAAGNLFVGSSTGALAVTNAVGKVVDLRDAWNNSFIKAYAAIYSGVIDGRGQAGFELINGAAGSDIIQAGDHGSQLWGGNDTATDALIGGGNSDIFIGGKNFGADTFLNASSADLVHLSDASLSDIVATAENNGTVGIAFNNGNVVTMQSTENISAAVMLADGNAYRYNHTNKSWQTA